MIPFIQKIILLLAIFVLTGSCGKLAKPIFEELIEKSVREGGETIAQKISRESGEQFVQVGTRVVRKGEENIMEGQLLDGANTIIQAILDLEIPERDWTEIDNKIRDADVKLEIFDTLNVPIELSSKLTEKDVHKIYDDANYELRVNIAHLVYIIIDENQSKNGYTEILLEDKCHLAMNHLKDSKSSSSMTLDSLGILNLNLYKHTYIVKSNVNFYELIKNIAALKNESYFLPKVY